MCELRPERGPPGAGSASAGPQVGTLNRPGFAGGSNFCKDGAMGTKKPSKPYPAALRERAVRLVREPEGEHASPAAIRSIAEKVGCHAATLRLSVRQAERDQGQRAGLATEERERLKALEREARERRRANEILRQASACCAAAALDRRSKPGSRSSTSIAGSTGSSRSAGCRRSPRRPVTPMPPGVPTRRKPRRAFAAPPCCEGRSAGSGRRAFGSKWFIRQVRLLLAAERSQAGGVAGGGAAGPR